MGIEPKTHHKICSVEGVSDLREPVFRIHSRHWLKVFAFHPCVHEDQAGHCGSDCFACDRYGKRNLLTIQAGGSPCALLATFGGHVNCDKCLSGCSFCFYRAGPIAKASNTGTAGCKSGWCSHDCLRKYLDTMAPTNLVRYELLCQHSEVRDFVVRAHVVGRDPQKMLVEVEAWQSGEATPSNWIGGAKPMQSMVMLNALRPWPPWLEDMANHAGTTFLHELQAAAVVLLAMPEDMARRAAGASRGWPQLGNSYHVLLGLLFGVLCIEVLCMLWRKF